MVIKVMAKSDAVTRRIGQIAVVVSDHGRSCDFYARVFGLDHIFGTSAFRGEMAEKVQGLKNAASTTDWLIDDRERFQLEVFQYENPCSRPLAADRGISDVGYNRIIIAVESLAETSRKAAEAGASVDSLPCGGNSAGPLHALLSDPDGILLEIVEAPKLVAAQRPARIIGLGITSSDIDTTVDDMCAGFGFSACEDIFQHEAIWQQDGQLAQSQTLQLDDMYLVVSQYRNARLRPEDQRLSDIGVMNFAIFFPGQDDFQSCYETTRQMGMKSNCEPISFGQDASITYNNDRQGFSVEMIYLTPKLWGLYGFARPKFRDRLINKLTEYKSRRDYKKHLATSTT